MKKIIGISALFAVMLSLFGCSEKETEPLANIELTMLNVGKADAMILCTSEHTVVIDCGEKGDGKQILKFLEEKGISKIDCMIITHFDQDHVGGAAKVIKKMDVEQVIAPDYAEESKEVDNFYDALSEKNITPVVLDDVMEFSFDGADFRVYPPELEKYPNNSDNNKSIVTTIKYGDKSMLFAADAMELRLAEIMDIGKYDFLKVPYHGRKIANLSDFLDSVQPDIAAVSTSSKEFEIAEILEEKNISYKATCNDGQIKVITDGKDIYFAD